MKLHFLDNTTSPELLLTQQLAALQPNPGERHWEILALHFVHQADYLDGQPKQTLLALVKIISAVGCAAAAEVSVSIFPWTAAHEAGVQTLPHTLDAANTYCQQHDLVWVNIIAPLRLAPVYIPKPWGQEIWYTGIEARGQAAVLGEGGSLPLPWVLEFVRTRLALGQAEQLILLKVLDPLADEGYGDLYFELHEQKQEVYVVTHVDAQAWPDGVGAIQLGFDLAVCNQYSTIEAFKAAYLTAVEAYQQARRAIDCLLDQKKSEQGLALNQPVAAWQLKLWINEISQHIENKELIESEKSLKQALNRFIAQHPLALGDVVVVPRLVPHALQHGVRVVEFQTPVYERKILSFGQKVLTQAHWDTREALDMVDMTSALRLPVSGSAQSAADPFQVQSIVNFDEFEVRRIRFDDTCVLEYERYCLLMVLEGSLLIDDCVRPFRLHRGDVVILPAASYLNSSLIAASPCLLLQAIPRAL